MANPSGVRLTRRGRLARTLLVLSLAVVLASVFGLNAGAKTADQVGTPTSFIQVTVAPGDTLWSIGERIAPNAPISEVVDHLVRLNGTAITSGQLIRIP